jgi:hypothetical protein
LNGTPCEIARHKIVDIIALGKDGKDGKDGKELAIIELAAIPILWSHSKNSVKSTPAR